MDKKAWKGKVTVFVLVTAAILSIVGVLIYRSMTFPAKECVKTIINVMCTGEFYPDSEFEHLTEENGIKAQELHSLAIEAWKERLKQYFGITALTEAGEKRLEAFVELLYNDDHILYEIEGIKKKANSYVVTIEIRSLAFYELVDEKELEETIRQKTEDGEYLKYSDEEYQTAVLELLLDAYESVLESRQFDGGRTDYHLKKKEYTLTLKKSGSSYAPVQKEFDKVQNALVVFSE